MMGEYGISDEITKSMEPEMVASRVFVGNLPSDGLSREELLARFGRCGRILGVAIKKGFGFIQFSDRIEAQRAIQTESGTMFKGYKIDVRVATEGRKRGGTEGGPGGPRPRFDNFHGGRGGFQGGPGGYQGNRFPTPRPEAPPQHHDRTNFGRQEEKPFPEAAPPPPTRVEPQFTPRQEPVQTPVAVKPSDAGIARPYDAAILALTPELRPYAEMIERRLIEMNLCVDVMFGLGGEEKVGSIVESFAARGLLYVLVLQPQHAVHKSLTLNILHGSPQEHRNMPLEDCLSLLASDFASYVGRLRLGAEQPSLSFLLHLLADSRHLSLPEIERVLGHLEARKGQLLGLAPEPQTPKVEVAAPAAKPEYVKPEYTPTKPEYSEYSQPPPASAVSQSLLAALSTPAYSPAADSLPSNAQINKTLNALLKNPEALRSLGLGGITLPSYVQPTQSTGYQAQNPAPGMQSGQGMPGGNQGMPGGQGMTSGMSGNLGMTAGMPGGQGMAGGQGMVTGMPGGQGMAGGQGMPGGQGMSGGQGMPGMGNSNGSQMYQQQYWNQRI